MDTSLQRNENNFDFLRLLAASAVVVGHSFWLSGNAELEPVRQILGYADIADIAVNLFFVMSGYLIAASWLNSRNVIDFLGKRALRIFPALIVSTLVTVTLVGSLATRLPLGEYLQSPQTLGYLSNMVLLTQFQLPGVFVDNLFPNTVNGSVWTLPYEVAMYSILMLLGLCRLFNRTVVLAGLALLLLIHFVLIPELGIQSQVLYKGTRLGIFFFSGGALYLYRKQVRWNWKIAAVLLAASLVSAGHERWMLVHTLTLPYLAIYLAHLRIPALVKAGKYGDFSYGVYIFSFPAQQLIIFWQPQLALSTFMVLSLVVSLTLAWFSWHLIEAPALALKRYLPRTANAQLPLKAH
ncbi:acyltransferase family protein [Stutzerimonas tarimensis]|uniref:Acyltransferase family protein n=1 Tax=Stutzerimonas tarimensis TaxID=1507735 RepID=A0ABV7T7I3_9GAMM